MEQGISFFVVNDQRSTAPKKGYSLRPLRLPTVKRDELARHVELDSQIDHARVAYIMSAVAKQIRQLVLNGHKVELGELGIIGVTCHATGSDSPEQLSVKDNVKRMQLSFTPSREITRKMQGLHAHLVTFENNYKGRPVDEHGAVIIKDQPEE